jgi:hypothetical protein
LRKLGDLRSSGMTSRALPHTNRPIEPTDGGLETSDKCQWQAQTESLRFFFSWYN